MPQFAKLFEPIRIGRLELRNRVIMSAMDTGLEDEGKVTDRLRAFYMERARGGAGLIITGCMNPPRWGHACHGTEGIYYDHALDGWSKLVRAVQAEGAKFAAQLSHAGRHASARFTGQQPIAPSAIPSPINVKEMPRELPTAEVRELIAAFVDGARRAHHVGFDAIELHGSAGFLFSQFLSPLTNQRTDEFGGSVENRLRFVLEIIRGIKQEIDAEFPIIYRISADEFMEGGNHLEDSKVIAQHLEAAGVDCINVTAGWHESPVPQVVASVPRGAFAYLAAGIKQAVHIPVAACNRINDPEVANGILTSGQADLITAGRAFLADPVWPRKAQEGRPQDIRRCIACCDCLEAAFQNLVVRCSLNPACGREEELRPHLSTHPKRIVVVGGGPGGLQAARVAADRGHKVMLFERASELGGKLVPGTVAPHKEELAQFRRYLVHEVEHRAINVKRGIEVTPELIAEICPDTVILASGSEPIIPRIPGADRANVATANDVLIGRVPPGEHVVIIGAGWVGCETALYLATNGKRVTLIEQLPRIGNDISSSNRWILLNDLRKLGVTALTSCQASEIVDAGVVVTGSRQELIEANVVVLSIGYRPDNRLVATLGGRTWDLHVIGDAVRVRRLDAAIKEAMELAIKI